MTGPSRNRSISSDIPFSSPGSEPVRQLVRSAPQHRSRSLRPDAEAELRPGDVDRGHDEAAEISYRRRHAHQPRLEPPVDHGVAVLSRPAEVTLKLVDRTPRSRPGEPHVQRLAILVQKQGATGGRAVRGNPEAAPVARLQEP